MTRYGQQYGPDFTFLGVPACATSTTPQRTRTPTSSSWVRRSTGAPRTGRARGSGRWRSGCTDYLPHDGSRPSLALRTDGLADLRVVDAGDVEMFSGDIEVALPALEAAVEKVARPGRDPGRPRRRPLDRLPRRQGSGQRPRPRPGLDDALRRARRHRRHRVRVAVGPRAADAAADRVRRPARRPVPADRPARLLAAAGDAGLDGRPADALLRDDRDRAPRPRRRASPRRSRSRPTTATACSCRSTSTSATPGTPPAPARPSRVG